MSDTNDLDPDAWVDEKPEPGDTAVRVDEPTELFEVLALHNLTAGEVARDGSTVADRFAVDHDRDVVLVVRHDDLAALDIGVDVEQLDSALRSQRIQPELWPVSMLAPLPKDLHQRIQTDVQEHREEPGGVG